MLRSRISGEKGAPAVLIDSAGPFAIPILAIENLEAAMAAAQVVVDQPFDFATEWPLRVRLYRIAPRTMCCCSCCTISRATVGLLACSTGVASFL